MMNTIPYNALIWDLDGTIIESHEGILKGMLYAREKMKLDVEIKDHCVFVGPPILYTAREYFGLNESDAQEFTEYFREYYREKGLFECRLYSGIDELLCKLQELYAVQFICTGKNEHSAGIIVERLGILQHFEYIYGTSTGNYDKNILLTAIKQEHGRDEMRYVMIGDRGTDINAANQTQIESIAVGFGYGSREELLDAGPTHYVETVQELSDLLLGGVAFKTFQRETLC